MLVSACSYFRLEKTRRFVLSSVSLQQLRAPGWQRMLHSYPWVISAKLLHGTVKYIGVEAVSTYFRKGGTQGTDVFWGGWQPSVILLSCWSDLLRIEWYLVQMRNGIWLMWNTHRFLCSYSSWWDQLKIILHILGNPKQHCLNLLCRKCDISVRRNLGRKNSAEKMQSSIEGRRECGQAQGIVSKRCPYICSMSQWTWFEPQ